MHDLMTELAQTSRGPPRGELGNATAHVAELRRQFRAPVADVWDACTDPDRVQRWFLPLSGDLRLGGHFRLEGNAADTIRMCEPPRELQVTWRCGEQFSLATLELASAGDEATELVLRHRPGHRPASGGSQPPKPPETRQPTPAPPTSPRNKNRPLGETDHPCPLVDRPSEARAFLLTSGDDAVCCTLGRCPGTEPSRRRHHSVWMRPRCPQCSQRPESQPRGPRSCCVGRPVVGGPRR